MRLLYVNIVKEIEVNTLWVALSVASALLQWPAVTLRAQYGRVRGQIDFSHVKVSPQMKEKMLPRFKQIFDSLGLSFAKIEKHDTGYQIEIVPTLDEHGKPLNKEAFHAWLYEAKTRIKDRQLKLVEELNNKESPIVNINPTNLS